MIAQSTVVVDVSLAVRWAITGPHERQARRLLVVWTAASRRLIAPALFASELASTVLLYARQNRLTDAGARTAIAMVLGTVSVQHRDGDLAERAYSIARMIGAGRAYDSLYIALAEAEGCESWTADEKLFNAAAKVFPFVRWAGAITI